MNFRRPDAVASGVPVREHGQSTAHGTVLGVVAAPRDIPQRKGRVPNDLVQEALPLGHVVVNSADVAAMLAGKLERIKGRAL